MRPIFFSVMYSLPTRRERFEQFLRRLILFLGRPNTYLWIAGGLFVLLIGGTLVLWGIEMNMANASPLADVGQAFAYMLQNVSGVALGAQVPQSIWGRAIALFVILVAAGFRALLVAAIVSGFVNNVLVQGKGRGRVKMENHVIICGWNSRVQQVIDVLQREAYGGGGVPIVLLAPLPQDPYPNADIKFISGNPMHKQDLERAGIRTARSAIAVTDESDKDPHSDSTYDARVVLTVLALKEANPKLHVVAQVRDPVNRQHLERARANEIIASAEMSEGLLARSALNSGLAGAFSQLLRLDTPQEIYIIDAPEALQGKSFQAALVHQQLRSGDILIGVVESDKTLMCPPPEYRIHADSRLIVLGNVRPRGDLSA